MDRMLPCCITDYAETRFWTMFMLWPEIQHLFQFDCQIPPPPSLNSRLQIDMHWFVGCSVGFSVGCWHQNSLILHCGQCGTLASSVQTFRKSNTNKNCFLSTYGCASHSSKWRNSFFTITFAPLGFSKRLSRIRGWLLRRSSTVAKHLIVILGPTSPRRCWTFPSVSDDFWSTFSSKLDVWSQ